MKYLLLFLLCFSLNGCDALKGDKGDTGESGEVAETTVVDSGAAIDVYEKTATVQNDTDGYLDFQVKTYDTMSIILEEYILVEQPAGVFNWLWNPNDYRYMPDLKIVRKNSPTVNRKYKVTITRAGSSLGIARLLY